MRYLLGDYIPYLLNLNFMFEVDQRNVHITDIRHAVLTLTDDFLNFFYPPQLTPGVCRILSGVDRKPAPFFGISLLC